MVWRLTSPFREYDRDEGIVVCYHPASGDTHLISELAADVLRALAEQPGSVADLAGRCAVPADELARVPDGEADWMDLLESTLSQLQDIHLVESDQSTAERDCHYSEVP